ncbi:5-methyltetrahydropteroyltriglutamate--homocysteine S-methyltransferase [Candidatus Vidania fulgoroideorum]
MKLITHIIGMPIIGYNRELKFSAENFFKFKKKKYKIFFLNCLNKINSNIIYYQKKLNLITLGNIKLFDPVMHTMCCLSLVPKRFSFFKKIDIEEIEILMKGNDKVKPMKMIKFFGNNFHYFKPEIDNNIYNKNFIKYKYLFIDKKINKKNKYSILGPNTFIKLCKFNTNKKKSIIIILKLYYNYIMKIKKKYEFNYLQIEEYYSTFPKEIKNFYKKIKTKKINIFLVLLSRKKKYKKIINIIKTIKVLHLNFLKNLNKKIINKIKNKCILSIGIINNNNIWINNYIRTIKNITSIKIKKIFIGPCGSFIHIPLSLKKEYKKKTYFSFSLEKINELIEIKKIIVNFYKYKDILIRNIIKNIILVNNKFKKKNNINFKIKRIRIKKKELGIKGISDTTIGSFPQVREIRIFRNLFKNNKINFKIYKKKILKFIKKNIKIQKKYKTKVLVNGEPERSDMIDFFCENYKGFFITKNGWVQSYGTRCVKPPILYKKPIRKRSSIKYWYKNIKNLKGIVTGPNTIAKWSFLREDIKYNKIIYHISEIISKEIKDLVKKGIKIIQIDEPAIKEFLFLKNYKKYSKIFINSFNYCCKYTTGKKIQIHTHVCYSELKEKDLKVFKKMHIDVLSLESSKNFYKTIDFIKKKKLQKHIEIGPGLYDVHSKSYPKYKDIEKKFLYMKKKIGIKNTWLNPDCGLKTRNYPEVIKYFNIIKKLKKMYK